MRVILDTNVVMSGLYFGGNPGRILAAWQERRVNIVVSPSILSEYRRVGAILSARHAGVDFEPFAALLAVHAEIVDAPDTLPEQVCGDADDDKFLACAIAAGVRFLISGDSDLLAVSGWKDIEVIRPRILPHPLPVCRLIGDRRAVVGAAPGTSPAVVDLFGSEGRGPTSPNTLGVAHGALVRACHRS